MNSTTLRRLALPALALTAALGLSACGGTSSDAASPGASSGEHGGGHGGEDTGGEATGTKADVAFLSGMKPHHEQAVEMSDIVLAARPPAEVAALATRVKQAQAPEIAEMDAMLADLGAPAEGGGHGGGHGGGSSGEAHGGTMSDADMAALRAATGTEAARLYLEGMIAHHEGAVEASVAEIADGSHAPAVALAERIKADQTAEIAEMRALLAAL